MTHSDIHAFFLKLLRSGAEVCLTVMIGEEYVRLDDTGSTLQLVCSHRIGLVAGQEGNVNVLYRCHFGNILRITGNVDTQSVNGQYVSVVL